MRRRNKQKKGNKKGIAELLISPFVLLRVRKADLLFAKGKCVFPWSLVGIATRTRKKGRIHCLCHFQSSVLSQSLSHSSSVITPRHDQLSFLCLSSHMFNFTKCWGKGNWDYTAYRCRENAGNCWWNKLPWEITFPSFQSLCSLIWLMLRDVFFMRPSVSSTLASKGRRWYKRNWSEFKHIQPWL